MEHRHEKAGEGTGRPPPQWKQPLGAALIMVVLIGAFYLLREHWEHLAGNWVYLLLLACPLMHLLHGHGGHGGNAGRESRGADRGSDRT